MAGDPANWWQGDAVAPTGEAALAGMTPERAAAARAIAEGRLPIPVGRSLSNPTAAQQQQDALAYDPGLDLADANARVKTRANFTSGAYARDITNTGTALATLQNVDKLIKNQGNVSAGIATYPTNYVRNAYNTANGDSSATDLNAQNALTFDEAVRAARGGGGNEADIKRLEQTFPRNGSQEQQRGALRQWAQSFARRLDEIQQQYHQGMGTVRSTVPGITDDQVALLKQFSSDDYEKNGLLITPPLPQGGTSGGAGNNGGPNPPAGGTVQVGPGGAGGSTGSATVSPLLTEQGTGLAKLDGGSDRTFSTDKDKQYVAAFQNLLNNPNAKRPDFDALSSQYGYPRAGRELEENLAFRAQHKGYQIPVVAPETGQRGAIAALANTASTDATVAGGNIGDAATFGTLNKIKSGVSALAGRLTGDNRNLGDIYQGNLNDANLKTNLGNDTHPYAALTGQIGGFVLGDRALGAGIKAAGEAVPALAALGGRIPAPLRPVAQDAAYGVADGAGSSDHLADVPRNALLGGVAAALGGALGRPGAALAGHVASHVLAPIAERLGRTGVGSAIEGYLGGGEIPRHPVLSDTENMLSTSKVDLPSAIAKLRAADKLGLPYALSDAAPELRALAGTATRTSPDALAHAEGVLEPRGLGQADRAIDAIDTHLAPITDIEDRSKSILKAGNIASGPQYNLASTASRENPIPPGMDVIMGKPGGNDRIIKSLVDTPSGKDALRRAYQIASDKGANPESIGLAKGPDGNISLRQGHSFETLDLVKKGLDARIQEHANPITGKVDFTGNPELQAVDGLRKRFVQRMDEINPDYASARAEYAKYAKRNEALGASYNQLSKNGVPQRQFEQRLADMKGYDAALSDPADATVPEAQRGYATSMADTVDRTRLSSTPLNSVYGTPNQQARIKALFPEGSDNFDQTYRLERDMGKTSNEVLGGSQTARRQAADAALGPSLADHALNAGVDVALTGYPVRAGAAVAKRLLADKIAMGIGGSAKSRADAISRVLFDTSNPGAMADMLEGIHAKQTAVLGRDAAYASATGRQSIKTLGDLLRVNGGIAGAGGTLGAPLALESRHP